MSVFRLTMLVTILSLVSQVAAQTNPKIVIIIDDLGYQFAAGQRAIALPGPVSFAVLPATPNGRALAHAAYAQGKEVLLHLPLESVGHSGPTEPGGITLDMDQAAFTSAFDAALESVPHAIGVSSHRGSLLTRHPGHMQWLMHEISARDGMFFLDSFTTHQSVAMQVAAEAGVAATRRHVFLDNDRSPAAIGREFERLTRLANQNGVAVGIGHPYPETLAFLERRLAELEKYAVELIPISKAINYVEPGGSKKL